RTERDGQQVSQRPGDELIAGTLNQTRATHLRLEEQPRLDEPAHLPVAGADRGIELARQVADADADFLRAQVDLREHLTLELRSTAAGLPGPSRRRAGWRERLSWSRHILCHLT